MLFLLCLLMSSFLVNAMDPVPPDAIAKAIRDGEHQKVWGALGQGVVMVNEPDKQGSYALHWAVMHALKKVHEGQSVQERVKERMQLVTALLRCGADYRLQERDSKRTVFHIIAHHLSEQSDNEVALGVFDCMLKEICRIWYCNAPIKEFGKVAFIKDMQELCLSQNKALSSVIDIVKQKKCVHFCSEERLNRAFEEARADIKLNENN